MHRNGASFCPACTAHVERILPVFEGRTAALPSTCGLRSKTPLDEELTLEEALRAEVVGASELPAIVWARAACEAPCPAARPDFIVRAGAGFIAREPLPPGWSRREAHCAAACRYPGAPSSAPELFTEAGVLEVSCQRAAGLSRVALPSGSH